MSTPRITSELQKPPEDRAEQFAKKLGAFLRARRVSAAGAPTQLELAARLEVDASWVSRVEKGQFWLRSAEDLETYAAALGEPRDEYLDVWRGLSEQWFGALPWSERIVFAETFRRQGERRAQVAKTVEQMGKTEIAPGIQLDVLVDAIGKNAAVREAVKAFCTLYAPRS